MTDMRECSFIRLLPDGFPVVRMDGQELEVELFGIEILQPPCELLREIFEKRLPKTNHPLRCEVLSTQRPGRVRGRLFYFGWQDKAGDVWKDVAELLLELGLARTTAGGSL